MKKIFTTILLACASLGVFNTPISAAETGDSLAPISETPAQHDARMKWWREARFGMFIHWGVYSVPAGEYKDQTNFAEWFLEESHLPVSQYEKFAQEFNPTNFDANAWVSAARAAGVKYIVITSKHHDGFGMFRSSLTDWCISRTPFQRDPIAELSAACQAQGITFCLYYSIMDWHHPDWGTRRPWNDLAAQAGPPNMNRYVAYMKGQLKELLTNYGPIGLLWFDGEWESPWTSERGVDLYNYVRSLQPNIIVNNRVGKARSGMAGMDKGKERVGDYGTPEQTIPPTGFGPGVDWESCMTMNDHWGYNRFDNHWKSAQTLVRNLIDCSSKGGNYLLNVGPTSQGLIPAPSLERLKEIGDWMGVNREAIYDTAASPFSHRLPWGRCTQKVTGNTTTLYLHVFDWPSDGQLLVPNLQNKIRKAWLLADPSQKKLTTKNTENGVVVTVPPDGANPISTTVVLRLRGAPIVANNEEFKATSSNVYQNNGSEYGPQFAFDGDNQTRWATDDATKQAWIAVAYPKPQTVNHVRISEAYANRVQEFELQYRDHNDWKTIIAGTTLGENYSQSFPPVTAAEFRLNILDATQGPTINEIEFSK